VSVQSIMSFLFFLKNPSNQIVLKASILEIPTTMESTLQSIDPGVRFFELKSKDIILYHDITLRIQFVVVVGFCKSEVETVFEFNFKI
jgi:hypothetical protein